MIYYPSSLLMLEGIKEVFISVMINTVERLLGREDGTSGKVIRYVTDRHVFDLRYAIDATKLKNGLCWGPSLKCEERIKKTVKWYLNNGCNDNVTSCDYMEYYKSMCKQLCGVCVNKYLGLMMFNHR